jgi:uncharacterized protein
MPEIDLEEGRFGRTFFVRLRPNIDLVEGVEAACREAGIANAVLRGALGSVNHAVLESASGRRQVVDQPGLEILVLKGAVSTGPDGTLAAELAGAVADEAGTVHAGRFRRGENLVCVTAEICVEEWLPGKG